MYVSCLPIDTKLSVIIVQAVNGNLNVLTEATQAALVSAGLVPPTT